MSLMALVDRDLQSIDGIIIIACHCMAAAGILAACLMQCADRTWQRSWRKVTARTGQCDTCTPRMATPLA